MKRKSRTSTFFLAAFAILISNLSVSVAQAQSDVTLRVANYGGVFTAAQKKYAADVFTAQTGVKVEFIDGYPMDHFAKMIAGKGRRVPFDVVYLDGNVQEMAIRAGVLEKLDASLVPNLKYVYDKAKSKNGYGPGMIFYSIGIAYNVEKFKEAGIPEPTSWADFWNPKLAGHVIVPNLTTSQGRDFLMAATLLAGGDENSLERGIEKIAELEALSYPSSSSTMEALFKSGEAWIAPWTNGRTWGLIDAGMPLAFVLPKEGGFGEQTTIDVVKGSPHVKEAHEYINYVLSPLAQLGQATEIPYGPTNMTLVPVLQAYPGMAKKFPASPADIDQLISIDWTVYNKNYAAAVDLWNREIISQ